MSSLPSRLHHLTQTLVISPPARAFWRLTLLMLVLFVSFMALSPRPPVQFDTGWDKLNHALAFMSLAFSGCLGFSESRSKVIAVLATLLVFAGAIEVLQTLVPGRSSEWVDLLASIIGAALGALASGAVLRALRMRTG